MSYPTTTIIKGMLSMVHWVELKLSQRIIVSVDRHEWQQDDKDYVSKEQQQQQGNDTDGNTSNITVGGIKSDCYYYRH